MKVFFAFIMDVRTGIFGVEAAAVTRAATTAIAKMAPCKRLFDGFPWLTTVNDTYEPFLYVAIP